MTEMERAHAHIGISPQDYAKRKRAAARNRKQGQGTLWLKHVDESTGDSYYENKTTGETQWTAPEGALVLTTEMRRQRKDSSGTTETNDSRFSTTI